MRKKYEGSFTVEASILVPMILFILIAVIYLMIFLHDRIVLQSFALRRSEALLWQQEQTAAGENGHGHGEDAVLMMHIENISDSREDTLADMLLSLAGSYQKSQVQVNGRLHIGIPGSAEFLGKALEADVSCQTRRIAYVDDYLKQIMLQKIKSGQ